MVAAEWVLSGTIMALMNGARLGIAAPVRWSEQEAYNEGLAYA